MSDLTAATRRRILADMGIDVWRPRAAAGTVAEPQIAERAAPAEALAALRAEAPAPAPPRRRRGSREMVSPPDPLPHAAPLSAFTMAVPGVVMLIEGAASRRDRRLAMDVLASACGDWQAKPRTRHFDWPPRIGSDAVAIGPEALRRALEAFIDKDLLDHGASVLLCSEVLTDQLPDRWPDCRRVIVPALDRLGRDAALKRALWQSLSQVPGRRGGP